MDKLYLICVDDQRDVLNAVMKDLATLAPLCQLEECESAEECEALMDELDASGDLVALVISDHIMPGRSGVELLKGIAEDPRFAATRKVLLTGQATHHDTIAAVNEARIDHYFEKPWDAQELLTISRRLITEFVMAKRLDYDAFAPLLDQDLLYRAWK